MKRIIRVFPRRTKATPDDEMAFVGDPPLFRPEADEVRVSCTFTWDQREAKRLAKAWTPYYGNVKTGGPAFDDPGGEFVPGLYLKPGYTITSRGCPNRCRWGAGADERCLVPEREGALRTLPIRPGWDILDNNLTACPRAHIEAVLDMLSSQPQRARFTGGLEARLMEPWLVSRIVKLRLDILYVAYDQPAQRPHVERAIGEILNAGGWAVGTARRKVACYVLMGYKGDTETAAAKRLEWIRNLGATPFPMAYQPPTERRSLKQAAFKRALRKYMRPHSIFAETT